MSVIEKIYARQILDSRGYPSVEVDVHTAKGNIGRASVPSGASTGIHEALELRDNNPKQFMGKGVSKAVYNVNNIIAPHLIGREIREQAFIDTTMLTLDGTPNKEKLGANTILGISLAVAKAAAKDIGIPLFQYIGGIHRNMLPTPLMNILNGGVHADNKIDFQEFMIVPCNSNTFHEALRQGAEVFHHLKYVLKKKGYHTNVGDEGGFAPELKSNEEAIETVLEAIHKAGYTAGKDFKIAIDAAASEMYNTKNNTYRFYKSTQKEISTEAFVDFWIHWKKQYPLFSLEDGMAEDDWKGWEMLTRKLGKTVQLVGDDLFVTNEIRLIQGIQKKIGNSILVKVNQIGTLTETLRTVALAHQNHYTTIISHRSGETEDTTIADLAVGLGCGQIKTGSASRTDRTAKYNQLLRIEEQLGNHSRFFHIDNLFSDNV